MTKLAYRTLSNRMVGKLEVEKDTVFWDRELTGFGVRVYPTGSKVYIAQARGTGGSQTCGGWPAGGDPCGGGAQAGCPDHLPDQGG